MWPAVWIAAASAALSVALAPAVVNGDGLGYLDASTTDALYPGHLAFLPLLRGLRWLFASGAPPVDGLAIARALSATSGAVAVLALAAAARRLGASATVAAAGLAASFGLIAAASDVETYAPALAALALALWAIARRQGGGGIGWLAGATTAVAGAALLHVENLLFVLPAALALRRRDRAPLAGGVMLIVSGAYALAMHARGLAWLGGASHGFHYPLRAATPAIALYGACKALVFSPYPYEASWPSVLAHFALGAAALIALVVLARGGKLPLGRAASAAWLLPYAAVGAAFFASDSERWVFLLPLAWLTVAAAPRERRRAALAVAALMAIANVAVWWPRARDDRFRARAHAAAAHARAGDLVISPGHGWDEYVGFYDRVDVERFPLVYFAGALGGREPLARALADTAARARAGGARILLVRLNRDETADPLGWKDLAQFGVTRDDAAALLPPGRRVPLGDGVEELAPLDPRAP
ncbi:MAG TPA: hypothetical protein VFF06_12605 [Polyangia bacterium]|nr:hypothetical protein [Polyangia bacterium]